MVTAIFPIPDTKRTHSYFPQPHKESRDDAAGMKKLGIYRPRAREIRTDLS